MKNTIKLNFKQIVWIFVIACFVGYVIEMIYCIVVHGRVESRQGVVFGPFTPIYGIGAVVMCFTVVPASRKSLPLAFVVSALVGGIVEFTGSLVEEAVLGTRSWDFSDQAFNIGGRTSLLFMLQWGVLGCVFARLIFPRLLRLIDRIHISQSSVACGVLVVSFSVNFIISALAIDRWVDRSEGIPPIDAMDQHLDKYYGDTLMKRIYPRMEFLDVTG